MKKSILFMGCLALLVSGCNKEQQIEEPTSETPRHLSFNITVNNDFDTRVVKTAWESGDKIYVVFDDFFTDEGKTAVYYLTMSYSDGTWTCSFSDSALEEYLLEQTEGKLTALYLPFGNPVFSYNSSRDRIDLNLFRPESNTIEVRSSSYSSCDGISYSVQEGVLSASLNMRIPEFVQFFIDGISESKAANYKLTNEFMAMSKAGSCYKSSSGYPVWQGVAGNIGSSIDGFYYKNGILFSGYLLNSVIGKETSYSITIVDNSGTTDASDDITYTLTRNATLSNHDSVKLPALNSGKWSTSINGHEYVDMGDAGKWATMNVGANKPEDYGDYFAWGEIRPKDDYSEKVYSVTPETFADAATVNWGEGWRMPTDAEWNTLISSCTWNTVNKTVDDESVFMGYNVVASNGNSIFLPAAGCRNGADLFYPGVQGRYWSSSIDTDFTMYLFFISSDAYTYRSVRYCGLSVRPIFDDGLSSTVPLNPEE